MMKNLPFKEKKITSEKIFKLARFNFVILQVTNFFFFGAAIYDITSLKYFYDSYKAVTITNWTIWIFLNIAIVYSLVKDKPKMMLYIHNLLLV
jgi:hypothetical protein